MEVIYKPHLFINLLYIFMEDPKGNQYYPPCSIVKLIISVSLIFLNRAICRNFRRSMILYTYNKTTIPIGVIVSNLIHT